MASTLSITRSMDEYFAAWWLIDKHAPVGGHEEFCRSRDRPLDSVRHV